MLISASVEPLEVVSTDVKITPWRILAHRLVYPTTFIAIHVTISTAPG
jgi:hypothetical protein